MTNALERWFESKKLNPIRELSLAEDTFDRFFNEMLNIKKKNGSEIMSFCPSCDISEDEKNYTLKFDMPGVPKEQVRVELDQDRLTIHAERKEEKRDAGKKRHLSEVYYGSYTRSFYLPGPVDEKKVDAKFENGVLTVMVPKTDAIKAKQIPVQ